MKYLNLSRSTRAVLFLLCLTSLSAANDPGDLDATFGKGGRIPTPAQVEYAFAKDMIIQPDGKIVTCGHRYPVMPWDDSVVILTRRLSNGHPDPAFGENGIVQTRLSQGGESYGLSLALQSDGKLVVLATDVNTDVENWYLARYRHDGTLDPSFGDAGKVLVEGFAAARTLAVQPDRKIIVAGEVMTGGGGSPVYRMFALTRYNPDGSPDRTFGERGRVITGFHDFSYLASILIQPDGKIIAIGATEVLYSLPQRRIVALSRYYANGNLDNTFGVLGKVITELPHSFPAAVDIQPDNKLVIVGKRFAPTGFYGLALRYTSTGILDVSFGGGVVEREDILQFMSVAVQANGKIIIGGEDVYGRLSLVRLLENSLLDPSFGDNGIVTTEFPDITPHGPTTFPPQGSVTSLAIQRDGKIISVGHWFLQDLTYRLLWSYEATARYIGDVVPEVTRAPFDFDGDGKTDAGIFRPSSREWWLRRSSAGPISFEFGAMEDLNVPGDYTGDGKTDVAVWRPSTGEWLVLRSEDSTYYLFPFGSGGDIPAPGDYDGDQKSDAAVFRPSTGIWYILRSTDGEVTHQQWGLPNDVPVAADYDGDALDDIAIFRPATGEWWLMQSSAGATTFQFGQGTDRITPGDYTGDGKADCAVWRPSTGEWFVLRSEDSSYFSFPFGTTGDLPAPGDYDGDGKFDAVVFRPSSGIWFVQQSTNGLEVFQWGLNGDRPVSGSFVR